MWNHGSLTLLHGVDDAGAELEELLRHTAPTLFQRFFADASGMLREEPFQAKVKALLAKLDLGNLKDAILKIPSQMKKEQLLRVLEQTKDSLVSPQDCWSSLRWCCFPTRVGIPKA